MVELESEKIRATHSDSSSEVHGQILDRMFATLLIEAL